MNKTRRKSVKNRDKEQGFIMIVGVIVMSFLLLLALPFLFQTSIENKLTDKSYKASTALSLAEAGIERAIWELNYGDISSWSGDSQVRTMSISALQAYGGNVIGDIEIRVIEPDADDPVAESTGRVSYIGPQKLARTVRSVMGGYPPFKFAAFGDEGIMIDEDVFIDSYDSRIGAYDNPGNVGSEGDIGTNSVLDSAIYIDQNANISGDAVSGHESDPDMVITTIPGANIEGVKRALDYQILWPSIIPPDLPYKGDYFITGEDTIFGSGRYDSFIMEANSEVTIEGDVTFFITADFYMDKNSKLNIADGASLTIYLWGGSFEMDQSSTINNLSEDPTKLVIFGTDSFTGEIYIDQDSQFYGAIYAPKASVRLDQSNGFYGAIIAREILFDQTTVLHYDKALEDLEILPSMGALYEVKSWQVKLSQ